MTTQVEPPHGTRACYRQTGCRCLACRGASAQARSVYRKRNPRRIPVPQDVLDTIERWRRGGMGLPQIARVAGVGYTTIQRLLRYGTDGPPVRVTTIEAIRQARPVLARGALVPVGEARDILTQLREEGFTISELGRRCGIKRYHPFQADSGRVRVSTALRFRALRQLYLDEPSQN